MPISVTCGDCGKGLKAPDALAGKKAKCPQCGSVVPIPAAVSDAEEFEDDPAPAKSSGTKASSKAGSRAVKSDADDEYGDDSSETTEESDDDRRACPMCGEMIVASAAKCRYCGEVFDARVSKKGRKRRGASDDYAGFGTRFTAAFVDGIITGILGAVVGGILGAIGGAAGLGGEAIGGLAQILGVLIGWLYSALQESSEAQATIGKKMMHIRVTDLDGNRISFGRASGRHFGKILSACILLIGYIMAAFTEKKQALHDIMAGTLVVRD